MLRFRKIIPVAAAITMTGCSAVNFGVDGLIIAPKLTKQQSEIHEALIQSVGSDITLKYPQNGDNRSAYVIDNIDNEPGDEAIVFYEYNGAGKKEGLWVNILDKNDEDEWVSVTDIAGAGSEIFKVIISPMDNNENNVIVVYQNIANAEKSLEVYRYVNGEFENVGSDNCSILETVDINNDNENELVIIQKKINNKDETERFEASLLKMENEKLVKKESVNMCENVTSYVNSKVGCLEDNSRAIYLDCLTNENQIQTEIVLYEDGKLKNPVENQNKTFLPFWIRPSGYYSMDIDKDSKIEIPSVKPMLGYENAVQQDLEYMTSWCVYDGAAGYTVKFSGYYSVPDGYVMIYPNRWNDQVTVKKDTQSGDTVFYKYDGDINGEMTELMRIAVVNSSDMTEYTYRGYQLIDLKGQLDYMVKLSEDVNEPLVLTIDEVQNSFYIVE